MREDVGPEQRNVTLSAALVPVVVFVAVWCAFLGVGEELAQGLGRNEDPDDVNWYLVVALVVGLVGPVVGIALAARSGRRVIPVLHGLVLAGTLVVAVVTVGDEGAGQPEPVPEPSRPAWMDCREHSGGLSTCPGG